MSESVPVPPDPSSAGPRPTPGPHLVLDARVARVTLLEDRAQVSREGKVRLEAGSHRLKIVGVAPVIADR
ncbi:MAG TPA: DUF4140 domain-containing protein, partial [bacterium]|nr:DUF4140 domain-containing protein [bacterium]